MLKLIMALLLLLALTTYSKAQFVDYSQTTALNDASNPLLGMKVNTDGSINVTQAASTSTTVKIFDGTGLNNTYAKVDTDNNLMVSVANLPVNAASFLFEHMRYSGSNAMNVSATLAAPKCFRYTNTSATVDAYVTKIVIVGLDVNIGTNKFYAEPILANGIQYNVKTNGTTATLSTFKQNEDLVAFSDSFYLNTTPSPNAQDFWFSYEQPLKLGKGNNDYVELCVRDNLTGLVYFKAIAKGFVK